MTGEGEKERRRKCQERMVRKSLFTALLLFCVSIASAGTQYAKHEVDSCANLLQNFHEDYRGNLLGMAWNSLSLSTRRDVLHRISPLSQGGAVDESLLNAMAEEEVHADGHRAEDYGKLSCPTSSIVKHILASFLTTLNVEL